MRVRAVWIAASACALAACIFQVDGFLLSDAGDASVAPVDLADDAPDGMPIELGAPDLSEDLADNVDFSEVDFTTKPIDLSGADLTTTVPGFPAHVAYHYLADSAADWTVVENTTLNTTTLSISSPTPAGIVLAVDGPYTVLALRKLSIGNPGKPDVRLQVIGTRPLVIVAGDEIHIYGLLDAAAHRDVPGPNGGRPATGDGAGGAGTTGRAGGGGAGYGTGGGTGGAKPVIVAGGTYGDVALGTFAGGSGGGAGKAADGTVPSGCTSPAPGGAGGGVLQLTSRSIIVESAATNARGTISIAGGGGSGGCGTALGGTGGGGGGGGSGGSLWIEAPSLMLGGRITGGGGGGGGGGSVGITASDLTDGGDGFDGFVPQVPGFSSFGGLGATSGGAGYNGITSSPPSAKAGSWTDFGNWGGGGGGAGAGRIRIRSSVAQNPMNTTPPPNVTVDLPATIP